VERISDTYTYRQVGSRGCEILDLDGKTVAWTIDDYWAVTICRLLNDAHRDLVVWGRERTDRQHGS
jgi:hypothetical protein